MWILKDCSTIKKHRNCLAETKHLEYTGFSTVNIDLRKAMIEWRMKAEEIIVKDSFKNKAKLKIPRFRAFKSEEVLKMSVKEILKFQDALF